LEREKLIERLMATFLGELEEHARALNRDLLALEKEPEPPARVELFRTLFRTAHSLKGASRSVNVTVVEQACHRLEEILAAARDGLLAPTPSLFQLLFEVADAIADAGRRLHGNQDLPGSPLEELTQRLAAAAGAGKAARPTSGVEIPAPGGRSTPAAASGGQAFARVPAAKLDELLDRSGELLVARRRADARADDVVALQEFVKRWEADWPRMEKAPARTLGLARDNLRRLGRDLERLAAGLKSDRQALERAAAPLEDEVHRVRMLPFAEACEGLERAVRDLAAAGGKDVDLEVAGGEVELDRAVLESLKDPLLHLVRNAVDHGIELATVRGAAGKAPRGRVVVSAALRSGRVEVVVSDDGRGLDVAAVRRKALEKRLPEPAGAEELARLLFSPGFSTSSIVTELSGRGVGLDVVKTRVESLRGTVDFSSEPGRGMRFVLTVPLTLTTIRVLFVVAAGETFALDAASVARLVRIGAEDVHPVEGREALLLGGTPVPVVPLAEVLALRSDGASRAGGKVPVVVVGTALHRIAFVVDDVLSEQEVLVKNLGSRLRRVRNVAGATLLATGRIALILNTADLVSAALGHSPGRVLSAALAEQPAEAKKRLLVVDDSVTTRTLEKSILEAAGYEVVAAVDGLEAWQLLQEKGADLVVADIEMPRMDGFALTEAIRGSKRFRELPVVLVTALESEKDKARGIEVGADAYLLKSAFDQKSLLEAVAQLL
jgi:two-component system, chemotaxis family, sensor kinase CheA